MLRTGHLAMSVDQGDAAYGVCKMRIVVRAARLAMLSWSAWFETLLTTLPNATPFSMLRVWYRQRRGLSFGKSCFIARNVHFLGIVSMGEGGGV
jgi:hypothetical protein